MFSSGISASIAKTLSATLRQSDSETSQVAILPCFAERCQGSDQ
ncbi:hypothetical protein CSB94_2957 [Pseudomonas aeruginosa]|nr:hypothetical protein CSB94_2957 [Pseudomonas aeruginosa]